MNDSRNRLLFVCSRNRRRSLTAETLFKDQPGWVVRSAGTEASARIKVTEGHLGWADVIVVMEKRHKERLKQKFPEAMSGKRFICLFIPDKHEYMEEALVSVLRKKCATNFPACFRMARPYG